ncbi:toprim domain-containing protein [Cetobacterium sp.]|uniref:toprim domain-containing protein n=1 Tax=Cetobacterium sp. TaxID=2071632 RepID=UPI003F31ABB7
MKNYGKQLEEITGKLGDYKVYGSGELRFNNCPICKEYSPDNPHFSINTVSGVYKCFASDTGGHINKLEGFEDLDIYKLAESTKGKVKPKKTPEELNEIFLNYKPLSVEWLNYLKGRGITKETADKIGSLGKFNQLAIPITNGKEITGIKYRTLKKEPSCESGSSSKYFVNWQTIQERESLIIVEGEIDLMSAIESRFNNTVSLPFGSSNLKAIDHQREWVESFKNIIIAVDNDEAGKKCKRGIIEKLKDSGLKLYGIELGKFKDLNEVLMVKGVEAVKKILGEPREIKQEEKEEKPRELIREDVADLICKFGKTKMNDFKERNEIFNKFAPYVFEDFYTIDGANYIYNQEKGVHLRMTGSISSEILNNIRDKYGLLLDTNTIKVLENLYYKFRKPLKFSKENTCYSYQGKIINIYTMEEVEKKPENITLVYQDVDYEKSFKNGNDWEKHLKDQYGSQYEPLLGFLYQSFLNYNPEIAGIIESRGRSGKGTLFETVASLINNSLNDESGDLVMHDSYDLIDKFRARSVLMDKIAFFDETEALSSGSFKKFSGNKKAKVELKGKDVEKIQYITVFVFFSNEIINMKSFKFAEQERLCLFRGKGIKKGESEDGFKPRMIKDKMQLLRLILTVGRKYYFKNNERVLFHNAEMFAEYEEVNNSLNTYFLNNYRYSENNVMSFEELDNDLSINVGIEWTSKKNKNAKGRAITECLELYSEKIDARVTPAVLKTWDKKFKLSKTK